MADTVTPSTATVTAGKKQIFSVPVTWVLEPTGEGVVDATGIYTAPKAIPKDLDLTVIANDADGREIGRSAIHLLAAGPPPPPPKAPTRGVLPASVALTAGQSQQFAAHITWALEPASAPGSIDAQSGLYEAPCDLSTPKSFCVVASANGRTVGRARVTVVAADAPVGSLRITPEVVEIGEGQATAFRVEPSDRGVVWDRPARGEISSFGVYASPKKIVASQSIVITARSVDGAQFGNATVKLTDSRHWIRVLGWFWVGTVATILLLLFLQAWPSTMAATSEDVTLVASPPVVTLNVTSEKMHTFTAEVLGVTDDGKKAVTWSLSPNAPGTVNPDTGVYTTGDESEREAFVTATSKTDPRLSSTARVYRTKDTSFKIVPPSATQRAATSVTFSVQRAGAGTAPTPPPSPPGAPGGTGTTTPAAPADQESPFEWSISPSKLGVVKLEKDGSATYSAPASIERTQVVTITAKAKTGPGIASASIILPGPAKASTSRDLLYLAFLMGALGSALHAVASLTAYIGSQKFVATWALWYFFRPFVGGALAILFYFLLAVGKVGGATLDPSWVALMAAMAGLFADKATNKLSEVFDALIGPKADPRTDKLEGGASSPTAKGAVPTIAKLEPASVKIGETPTLTITGTNFRKGVAVQVKGVQRVVLEDKATPTTIEVPLTKEDTASKGEVEIVVVNKDGTKSAAAKFAIT